MDYVLRGRVYSFEFNIYRLHLYYFVNLKNLDYYLKFDKDFKTIFIIFS